MTWEDFRFMAETAYGEARGEGLEGMRAVCYVILNRLADDRWPDDVRHVVLQERQFSCWNRGDPNKQKIVSSGPNDPVMRRAMKAAIDAISWPEHDLTKGANHYLRIDISDPDWLEGMEKTAEIGNHRFYKG